MSCSGTSNCTCGCCAGSSVQTPAPRNNPAGLPAVNYRVGTWASFSESMHARLSSNDYPALQGLKTRDGDDFSIALLDASAVVLDVLSFYQERLANEAYLRTAQQLRSLTELSRLIGYEPSPGVAASTYAAFSITAVRGKAPDPSIAASIIPQGTQVQSVPPPGQAPQIFETSADIRAKADWNALPVQTGVPWVAPNGTSVYLAGTQTKLQPGDSLLLLGVERETWTPDAQPIPSHEWQVVVLDKVISDNIRNLTYVSWDTPLGVSKSNAAATPAASHASMHFTAISQGAHEQIETTVMQVRSEIPIVRNQYGQIVYQGYLYGGTAAAPTLPLVGMSSVPASSFVISPWASVKVFAFRQKAALFGHNAPNPNLFVNQASLAATSPKPEPSILNAIDTSGASWRWANTQITANTIDLDATYPKVVTGSWIALTKDGAAQLYQVTHAQTVSRADFAMSAKVTRLAVDYQNDPLLGLTSGAFTLPETEVWLQSDALTVSPQPLNYPLYGAMLDLQDLRPDLIGLTMVAISGKRQKIAVADRVVGLSFAPDDGTPAVPVSPGDVFTLMDPAPLLTGDALPDWSDPDASFVLSVQDAAGRSGAIQTSLSDFVLAPSDAGDPLVSEAALVSFVGGTPVPYAHTQIQLQSSLANCYERASTSVNANVALVTQGQSVSEFVGSGNGSMVNQSFLLKQKPLTYVPSAAPSGRASTVQLQVNGASWSEVGSLYGMTPSAQVFEIFNQADGTAAVLFGDGEEGALLPSGQNNLRANYRIGLGSAGNLPANTLTTLIDRPAGVSGVTNPQPATGGQDAQSIEDIRSNAPLSVLTLGRAVSISDYENFAASFAGIAKAHALWIPSGRNRGVFVTVAGVGGAALPAANPTLNTLLGALRSYGNPLIPVTVQSFVETLFGFSAELKYDPRYAQDEVRAQVLQTLTADFGFTQRDFGQSISVDEIAATIQQVTGVIAVNVHSLKVIASSLGGDLAGYASGFSLSNWRSWLSQPILVPRPASTSSDSIPAFLPTANAQYLPLPAEILVIDPDPGSIALGLMT